VSLDESLALTALVARPDPVRVRDYLELVERSTYRGDRVRPCGS